MTHNAYKLSNTNTKTHVHQTEQKKDKQRISRKKEDGH